MRAEMIDAIQGERSVFINCPFDEEYQPLFQAVMFAVARCGFFPRCSLEGADSGEVRIEKIAKMIGECRYGIHDLSRVELSSGTDLPRFNMPFELGLFLGARRFGGPKQRRKVCLVLDSAPYRYQAFLSDIAGQDIRAHGNAPRRVVTHIRDWLRDASQDASIPGGDEVHRRYEQFQSDLPRLCRDAHLLPKELTFLDLSTLISEWLSDAVR